MGPNARAGSVSDCTPVLRSGPPRCKLEPGSSHAAEAWRFFKSARNNLAGAPHPMRV